MNDLLIAFEKCEILSYTLSPGITNYGIAELVYGTIPGSDGRNENIAYPDYESDTKLMAMRYTKKHDISFPLEQILQKSMRRKENDFIRPSVL